MNYNYKTALAEQIDDMAIELDEIRQDRERLIKRNNEWEEECDSLAYENGNMAEFIKYNNSTLTDTDVGDIACGTPDVWDRFIAIGSHYLLSNNIEQRETIRELRRKLTKVENICNNINEE